MALSARVATRRSLAFLAAVTLTATLTATAVAQETENPETGTTTTTTTTESTPSTTTGAPTTESAPTTSTETTAAESSEPQPSSTAAAKLDITATTGTGPYLVGRRIPVEVTITNTGDADATGVKADSYTASGSSFFVQSSEWGDLATWPTTGAGATVPAGQKLVRTVHGEVQQWSGAVPLVRFTVRIGNAWADSTDLSIPLVAPDSGTDTAAGLVYGDRNGNSAPDAGEGLADVAVRLYAAGQSVETRTDAEGRFRFTDLPVRVYSLSVSDVPDGWVITPAYSQIEVDGNGSAANVVLRGERPLTDRLSASMRFTKDLYNVGDRAEIQITLTNSGTDDLAGLKAFCDRSGGEGPELRDVDLGELGWTAPGVAVPAGQSRTFTISGAISPETEQYGSVVYGCDFGPEEQSDGHPVAVAWARVPAPPADLRVRFYHDRDGDQIGRPDEMLPGVVIGLKDVITGAVVAKATTDAEGRVLFQNVPAGPYEIRVYGPWTFRDDGRHILTVGSCRLCQSEATIALVPGPDVPEEDLSPVQPPAAGGDAAPTGGALAQTGASVLGLAALGLLALVGGFGTLLYTRRRSA
ncbi:SdrD B-like domain-containing protein [Saccharothrix variisporea]|uniref:LPXTG-motif cell wall-anchored protein n=1 Tax=Saccharothrix variisporea TaxID=543527 RepID=A0A495XBI6_9PSEU|nr:SdrD B-like domain-containing protein [Saccharothrix variisporea]RKT71357.1 LPXTG-motif cell wall-anchored protein [Saccharothrix variisporea]